MLTPQEALLFQAVKDEQARQEAADTALSLGAIGGAGIGVVGGQVPHMIGKGINKMRGRKAPVFKPGPRMAGGLTGAILGGALGAGSAALMKQESQAAQLLGKLQAQGGQLSKIDEQLLSQLLGDIYQNPSQLM
jgi:hypothetical protein